MAGKSTLYKVSIGTRSTRVRVPNDLTDEFTRCPVSESEAAEFAITKAVRKLFGRHANWKHDPTDDGYGYVVKNEASPVSFMTKRVRLTVKPRRRFVVDEDDRRNCLVVFALSSPDHELGYWH